MAGSGVKTCPDCKATFSTKAALSQHRLAKHGTAAKPAARVVTEKVTATVRPAKQQRGVDLPVSQASANSPLRDSMLMRLGSTAGSRSWALRYLHPNDESSSGGVRIPDNTVVPTVAAELRVRHHFQCPSDFDHGLWDLLIVVPPSSEIAAVVLARESGKGGAWTKVLRVINYPAIPASSDQEHPKLRPLQPSALGNLGDSVRTVYKGITCNLNASSTTNQGMVYAAQWGQPVVTTADALRKEEDDQDWVEDTKAGYLNRLPLSVDDLFAKEPRTVSHPAREGVYMPMRYVQPVSDFSPTTLIPCVWRFEGILPDGKQQIIWLDYAWQDGTTGWPLPPNGDANKGGHYGYATLGDNMTTGVIIFDGISAEASVEVKLRQGVEATVASHSSWAPFVDDRPSIDEASLKLASAIAVDTPLAYPARYNDLGFLWSKVISPLLRGAVRLVGPSVMRWAQD